MTEYRPGVRGVVSSTRVCLATLPKAMGARHEVLLSPSYTRHAPVARFAVEPKTLLETSVKALLKTVWKTFVKMVVKAKLVPCMMRMRRRTHQAPRRHCCTSE